MRKSLIFLLGLVYYANSFAQINTGSPQIPFGSNTRYQYGIMPTSLPTTGTYGTSSKAAIAYEAWKTAFVTACGTDQYRVKFDDNSSTVSEGIAYGMLLSVYASDKALFDGLWAYYKANMNGNGIMNWKIAGCTGVTGGNGATDAELDVAMALVIASEQWKTGSSQYLADAKSMIQKIKNLEMTNDGQTLNGDAWGNTNSCRNPSYFAPAYYTEFAKVDPTNATFWNTTAINASNTLLTANRNSTSGLVSNWCDNSGTENACGNTGSGAYGYGADACRNPWRMAVDYLWHGTNASTAAKDINGKLITFVNGFENQLKGPLSSRSVSDPSGGSYVNGSYTTFALPTMTSASAQGSLNKCYTSVASISDNDLYFNTTIRCLSLFTLTGNFWAPGSTGLVYPPSVVAAVTNGAGSQITLTTTKALTTSTVTPSTFSVYLNNTLITSGISSVTISGTSITLGLATAATPQPGQVITLSYSGTGAIKSADGASMEAFTKMDVLNLLEGNETILDDCEDGNELNNVGGIWFSFNDSKDQKAACTPGTISSITPLSSAANPLKMTAPGYSGSAYALNASFTLGTNYTPYNGTTCASWKNPSYVGIGTWVDDIETNTMDWRTGTGVSFWYKGSATSFQVIVSEVTDFCFHQFAVPACATWTKITVKWTDLAQPTWGKPVTFSAQHVQKLQWQYGTDVSGGAGATGTVWIDDVRIMGMVPVALTSMKIGVKSTSKLLDPLKLPKGSTDTLKLEITPTPANASYPVVFWSSSDETVATVDYQGNVKAVGYGDAVITARAKMHQNVTATFAVKVPAPTVNPTSITFTPTSYSVGPGESTTLIPSFGPAGVTETGLTWTSSNTAIATVNSGGVVTGVAVGGPVTITATSTAATTVKGTATVTVTPVLPTALAVTLTPASVVKGKTSAATVDFTPATTTNKTVTWASSDITVATVDATGAITAVGVGTATITATSSASATVKGSATITVTAVLPSVIAVTLNPTSIATGATSTASVEVLPLNTDNKAVVWTSSDANVATVNANGVVTAVGAGTATITATSSALATVKGTATITVVPGVTVDTKPLVDAVAAAKVTKNAAVAGEGDGQYPSTAIAAYASAITTAEGVITTATTQTQISDAVKALDAATTTFTATKYTVSKVALKDSITKASASIKNLVGGNGNGQYPQTAIDTYSAAITAAQAVYDNANASQATVKNAVTTLDDATKAFNKTLIVVDYTALKAKVTAVTTLLGTITVGDGNGQYPAAAKTALENAQSTANLVATNGTATQKQVDDAFAALTTAITTFNNSVIVVDYSGLTTSITTAQNTLKAASIGNGNGQYPTSAQTDLQTAISTADAVAKNTSATQSQVTAAKDALDAAVKTFNGTLITVSLTDLDAAITTASDLKKAAVVGTADGQYTTAVVADFTTAISAATTVQGTTHVTKAAVDQAITDLNAAIDLFKKSANTSAATDFSALSNAITAANAAANVTVGTNPCEYPSAAAATFTAAIKVAQDMVTAGTAKQGEVNSQITTLNSAKSTFLNSKNAEASKADLNKAISDASATFTGKVIGNNPGQYPAADSIKLKQAIIAAQTVAANTCATVSQVSTSKTSVDDAVAAFLAAKVKEASKTELASAIATADPKAATPASSIGSNPGQYSQASFSALTAALSAAKIVYANATATPAEVLKATQDLNAAITAFDNSKIGAVNKTALNDIIAKAKAFKDSTISKIGLNPGQYPSAVISALNTKYDAAVTVSITASSLQPAIDAATEGLTTAYETAVASRVAPLDKTELATTISSAITKVPNASEIGTAVGQYQQALVTTLTDAIAAGNIVKANLLATSTQIATAVANIKSAVAGLVKNTTSGGGTDPVVKTNTDQLVKNIDIAANLLQLATPNNLGTLPTQYNTTTAKINALTASLAAARAALTGSQASIDFNNTELVTAINDVASTLVASPDKSSLSSAVTNAIVVANYTVISNRYPSALVSEFLVALEAAKYALNTKTATAAQIRSAEATLSAAKTALLAAKVDATVLVNAISDAQDLMTIVASNVGTVPTTYLKADSTNLSNAIIAAQTVLNNAAATQAEVSTAAQTLISAAKIKIIALADRKALMTALFNANLTMSGAQKGTKPGDYPAETFDALYTLIYKAENQLTDKATQAEINKLVSDINSARAAFILSKIEATTANLEVEATTVELVQNPVAQFVHLQAKNGTIVSVQILGLLTGGAEVEVNASDANIDVSDLASSCYFASVKLSNGKTKVLKFVK